MTTRTCSQCEAPLPIGAPGETVSCTYCGAEHEPENRNDIAAELGLAPGKAPSRDGVPAVGLIVFLALVAAIVVVVGLLVKRSTDADAARSAAAAAADTARAAEAKPAAPEVKKLPVAELGRAELDMDQEIDAPPPTTALSAFDAVANLEWATRIARAWSTDAEIWDLAVRGLRSDGTADVTSRADFSVEYQFKSAARRAAAIQLGAVSEKGVPTDLDITVKTGRVTVRSFAPTAEYLAEVATRPALQLTCQLAKVVEVALGSGLMRAPFWNVEISFKDELGWNWSFDYGTRRVSTADCAVAAPKKPDR